MIISINVKVKMSHWYIEHYRKLGYIVEKKDIIEVPIKDLALNDSVNIIAKCEKCSKEKEERYKDYILNKLNHYYSCSYKCSRDKVKMTNLERFGNECPFLSKELIEKGKRTCLEKYGVDHASKSQIVKDKVKKTNLERFGVEYKSKTKEWKESVKEKWNNKSKEEIKEIIDKKSITNLKKYGKEHVLQLDYIRDRLKETALERYGVDHFSKAEEIKEKKRNTFKERYGVEYALQYKEFFNKFEKTMLERYGVDNSMRLDIFKYKIKKTNLERYGVENYSQLEFRREYNRNWMSSEEFKIKSKNTVKEKYGVDNIMQSQIIIDKIKEYNNLKYNTDWYMSTKDFKEKSKITCLEKYGYEYAIQNKEIHDKQQMSGFKAKKYINSDLIYRGSYELDFLNNYFDSVIIESGISVKYKFEDKNKVYHSDFFLPKHNLIIEIKSYYYYNKYLEKNLAKQKACIEQGYNFIFIINKDYKILENLYL